MTLPLIAIVGRPNVGKSTLFNRLAGKNRALVQATPGVTRDLHYAPVEFAGKRFMLVDTGGLSTEHTDALTHEVNLQVEFAIEEAAAIICLMDGRGGLNPEDEDVVDKLRRTKKNVFWAVNKIDAASLESLTFEFFRLGVEKLYSISAREKIGIKALMEDVVREFPEPESESDEEHESAERPVRVAFVGVPNVGKSSSINRILGEKRLIVSDLPGTTRDAIDVPFDLDGKPYVLIDTAGLRRKGKAGKYLEKLTAIKALQALDRTDIAVVLHEAGQPITDQTMRIISYAEERGRGVILALNKVDLAKTDKKWRRRIEDDLHRRLSGLEWIPVITMSARTGEGIQDLFSALSEVRENQLRRLQTGPLNRYLEGAVAHHGHPSAGSKPVKFYYMSQIKVRPPIFVVFTNRPAAIHFAYRRYLINRLRDVASFDGTPIRLIFKGRQRSDPDKT
ncbi:MAG: ribosome biogenesis GTPase Der [Candidatus Lernaella stagnicola]|nr:ribosome biogenesis GTPase Der [Candidatus Lernaella stagnicola]